VPRFAALVEDLFALCFKNNLIFRDARAVAPSAHPNQPLLARFSESPALAVLREQTILDEVQAGIGALILAEGVLDQIRAGRLWTRGDLRDLWDLSAQEDDLRHAIEMYEAASNLADHAAAECPDDAGEAEDTEPGAGAGLSPDAKTRLADTAAGLEHETDVAEATLRQKARRIAERARDMPRDSVRQAEARALMTARELLERPEGDATWGLGLGSGHRSSPGQQLEFGKRLVTNPKLKRLAQLVGRMQQSALRLRKTMFERANEETYAVSHGQELSRLLPHELVSLRHPVLRRDFQRRLIEGQLQLYELRGAEEKGRGPMVVCLDGSSSMAGDKELWSKAVTLTLLDIARRQRRLFRFLCFSSADQPLWTLDLNPAKRYEVDEAKIYDLAEYFPGGGTDFESPLNAAVDCLGTARYKRGDVVFITDGECRVSPAWLAAFRTQKARLGFSVFSVLIDVGMSTVETVREFSDWVTSIQQLTDDAARDLFLTV
jgi:uncharacterized protein with von Willebrand factor type A (vWA) domain